MTNASLQHPYELSSDRSISNSIPPLQLEDADTRDISARKRKDRPVPPTNPPTRRSKRQCTELEVIDIDDDKGSNNGYNNDCYDSNDYDDDYDHNGDEDDDGVNWNSRLVDMGYQDLCTSAFSVEHTPTIAAKTSDAYSRTTDIKSDPGSQISLNQYSRISPILTPPKGLNAWSGPEGGAIKFRSKPPGFNEKAFSRWSYSATGPKNLAVDERTSGDIHFSPSNGFNTSEPFSYWVCVNTQRGMQWVDFKCGQQHPLYEDFVLKPVNTTSNAPPKWVKKYLLRRDRS
ncbi:hypothetical protein BN14_11301 [Rhizoctonia solani AG-1 IB]|uniref:Uncharacterized protein n=1 Tax=Thanatephorus cucumeris (strain AG1-IB / isolate 7/3/14) TaxID=1108050 RepID=M5CD22_THACB|nr:hypothetical protein BN14_11301 [Rhizoctonia solani AG-1 IB]